ncbi:uncharacterized protein LY89DRAFT_736807 [Mollisia scopiformis]|uniref:Uncharacterized protein n=1 Tax=Mollisia scopiformis TaxID=149040 RepID=A0A194X0U7_MOLSC|nr:uncharacterized protein LY89DRAFT_736807 [Mollisia scopiformis]KUJ13810.1 hypothetical protein LY89DRAFT_736807 [Mollisia scopiformis]
MDTTGVLLTLDNPCGIELELDRSSCVPGLEVEKDGCFWLMPGVRDGALLVLVGVDDTVPAPEASEEVVLIKFDDAGSITLDMMTTEEFWLVLLDSSTFLLDEDVEIGVEVDSSEDVELKVEPNDFALEVDNDVTLFELTDIEEALLEPNTSDDDEEETWSSAGITFFDVDKVEAFEVVEFFMELLLLDFEESADETDQIKQKDMYSKYMFAISKFHNMTGRAESGNGS